MSFEDRILGAESLRPYLVNKSDPEFLSLIEALYEQQLATWPMLREAVSGFGQVEYRKLSVKSSEVLAQFNPQRIVSTGAKVDAATIRQRPCFLCSENLPKEERGVAFGQDFIALYNPFPVLPRHLVISARRHIPQTIEGNFGTLLDLALELGDDFFVIYNGAACGASAPDHLHFQASERKLAPIILEIERWEKRVLYNDSRLEIFALKDYRLNALIARGSDQIALVEWFDSALTLLAAVTGAESEPMINLVATREDNRWTVIIYPRSKHRPDRYFAEGDDQLTVSPAAIDLSGVLVVPRPDHFAKINAQDVEDIYAEVTLNGATFEVLLAGLLADHSL